MSVMFPFSLDMDMDPITKNWKSTQLDVLATLLITYFGFHLVYPKFEFQQMDPAEGRTLSFIKNGMIAFGNVLLALSFIVYYFEDREFNFRCEPCRPVEVQPRVNYSHPYRAQDYEIRNLMWAFFWLKCLECLDTVCSVIRTNITPNEVVGHHVTLVFVSWTSLAFAPGGTSSALAVVNCVSHAIVYGYLAVSFFVYNPIPGLVLAINRTHFLVSAIQAVTATVSGCGYPNVCVAIVELYVFVLYVYFK